MHRLRKPESETQRRLPSLQTSTALHGSPREIAAASVDLYGRHEFVALDRAERSAEEYPTKSPFNAVRWQDDQPEVRLDDEWFKLVSLNEIPAAEIVAFSQQTYERDWQQRFEEDLVELLTRMEHPPADKVTLVVQSLASSETSIRENVPMTKENRSAIYRASGNRSNR